MTAKEKTYGMTGEGRFAFVNLLEPKPVVKNGKPVYSVTGVFDAVDVQDIMAAMKAEAQAKWPNWDIGAMIRAGDFKWPFKNGDKEAEKSEGKGYNGDHYKGQLVLQARSDFEPDVIGPDKGPIDLVKVYAGCYGYVQGEISAYDAVGEDGKPGVKIYLQNVMKSRDGERLAGGGQSAAQAFGGIKGQETSDDPTGGDWDDEIPF